MLAVGRTGTGSDRKKTPQTTQAALRSKRPTNQPGAAAPGGRSAWPSRGRAPAPGLHIVATPIGDLDDITLKALDVLHRVDLIACEDTRVTRRLLDHFGIATHTTPYHDHNAAKVRPGLLARLAQGGTIALVSDAGTPLISDPGYRLVAEARTARIDVFAVPGASSVLAALSVAGLPTDRFHFAGFLPTKASARQAAIAELAGIDATLVLFETAQRIGRSVAQMADVMGARPAAICRELTKLHETVHDGDLTTLAAELGNGPPLKGEIVLVVAPPDRRAETAGPAEIDAALTEALVSQSMRDAVDAVAAALGQPRRRVYQRALALGRSAEHSDEADGKGR